MKVKAEPGTAHAASLYEELTAASQAYDEEELLRQAQADCASMGGTSLRDAASACWRISSSSWAFCAAFSSA